MMLDLLLLTRHLPVSKTVAPAAQHTASDEDSGSSSEPKAILPHSQPPLAAVLLDVLFAVLVDAPDGVRVFERAGGLEIVRKVLKSKSVVKDVRCVVEGCPTATRPARALTAAATRSSV